MKKLLLALVLMSSSVAFANPTIDQDRVYEIDAWGSNPDIIEFTPIGHPEKVCLILVSGGDESAGLFCFDRKKK